jgi:hypothetical protein
VSIRTSNPRHDPLLSAFELPLSATFYPLGFPLEITTNSADVLSAARESWGRFRKMFSEEPLRLRIGVLDGNTETSPSVPVVRSRRHLMAMVGGTEDFAFCDMSQGFGCCWLAAATAGNHAHLRYYYLESMTYILLQSLYLTPIHAACVALNGNGLLLCGDSGAGKSSLAYACARGGWTFVSDDASYLVRGWRRNVVVGNPHIVRLREQAVALFPELRRHPVTLRANGDRAIELPTTGEEDLITAPHSSVHYVLFLQRQDSCPPKLAPFSRETALGRFEEVLSFGESQVREAQAVSLRALLSAQVLEFRYSDLDSAVAELKTLVGAEGAPKLRPRTFAEMPGK